MAGTIIENSKVRLVTAVAAVLFFVGGAVKVSVWMRDDALWKLGSERDLAAVKNAVAGRAGERWTRKDQRQWTRELRDENTALSVPDVPEGDE